MKKQNEVIKMVVLTCVAYAIVYFLGYFSHYLFSMIK